MNAAERDALMQRRKAEEEGRPIEPCTGLDRGLPCTKIAGHDGPCYFRWPGP